MTSSVQPSAVLPTWTCTADVQPNSPLFATATFVFASSDGRTHTYTEPRVVDVSDAAIAKLARDQVAQLQRMDALAASPVRGLAIDLAPADAAVVDVDPAVLDAQAKQAAISDDLRLRIQHKNAVDLGLIPADDPDVVAVVDRLQQALKADASSVLGLLG